MADNHVAGQNEAEVTSKGDTRMAPGSVDEEMKEDGFLPVVVSDLIKPQPNNITRPLHSRQQTPQGELKMNSPLTSAKHPSTPSGTRLAVHIRSSSATPRAPFTQPYRGGTAVLSDRARKPPPPKSQQQQIATMAKKGDKVTDALAFNESRGEGPALQTKKRGRPKGWKPGMSYASSSGDTNAREPKKKKEAAAANGQGQEPKRRGRPPRAPEPSARNQYLRSNPEYQPYKCEWIADGPISPCPAELQNMETLRKHVSFIHGDAHPLICRWPKCAQKDAPVQFATPEEFDEHIEEEHFQWYLWHMGEGYQNEGVGTLERDDAKLPLYLFDKDGRQVTPSVRGQQEENDQQYKERKRRLKKLLIQQNENAVSEDDYLKQAMGISG
ncbi:Uu.00g072530.m01.CDS01 [Anthostomella pinea]|uniref:Uu.00g072530.m01.CDS01 n=1 Tax=Anthostomella pinea TaxID=933095 RepID=A0AAI8YNU6_9PEZI|nr:Uu.00g072530.m01.CDS01 [Anthostomella pinea]